MTRLFYFHVLGQPTPIYGFFVKFFKTRMLTGQTQKTTRKQKSKQSRRIAIIVSKFPCIDETFILREIAVLAANGFDIDIYSIKKSHETIIQPQAAQLQDRLVYRRYFFSIAVMKAQINFLRISPGRYLKTLFSFVVEMWRAPVSLLKCLMLFPKAVCYSKLMQQRQTAHIHAAWASYPCAVAWVAHHLAALPYSFSAHAHDIYEENSMLIAKLQKAEFVLTCTAFNRKHLQALVPERANSIKHIYHGLDLQKFREDAAHHKNETGALRILSIGTLYKTKGFDVLIETCALLKQYRIPFRCKIVGDGPERKNLQRRIAMHGLREHVLLLGYLEQEALRPLRHWANIFILLPRPYLHWGLPNVFIESLASKLAVIATPVNAVCELVRHEETGLIVESDNPKATSEALLRMQQFPDDRRRMAEAGQRLAYRLFDVQKTSPQLVKSFREVLAGEHELHEVPVCKPPVSNSTPKDTFASVQNK